MKNILDFLSALAFVVMVLVLFALLLALPGCVAAVGHFLTDWLRLR